MSKCGEMTDLLNTVDAAEINTITSVMRLGIPLYVERAGKQGFRVETKTHAEELAITTPQALAVLLGISDIFAGQSSYNECYGNDLMMLTPYTRVAVSRIVRTIGGWRNILLHIRAVHPHVAMFLPAP